MEEILKILLVDDEHLALMGLEHAVRQACPQAEILKTRYPSEALRIAAENPIQVAMLDIEMPVMNGIQLAKELKKLDPKVNIIFVTAYSQYALQAIEERVSGYLLKPAVVRDVERELSNLRHEIAVKKHLHVQCFGKFEVYCDSKPVIFERSVSKEIFAYLIALRGASANTEEICGVIWNDPENSRKRRSYFRTAVSELKKTLERHGVGDAFVKGRNSFSIDTDKLDCDYYQYLDGTAAGVNSYMGEFMSQYEWAVMSERWI